MTEHDLNWLVCTVSSHHVDGEKCHTTVFNGPEAGVESTLGVDVVLEAGNISFSVNTFTGMATYNTESCFG